MTLKPIVIGIPLAFEYPSFSGPSTEKSGTRARIESCYKKLLSLGGDRRSAFFVVTANKPPNSKEERTMCFCQKRLFNFYYSNEDIDVCVEPTGWGTESEIKSAIDVIKHKLADTRNYDITLVVATNWAHMPRVWLLVAMYKPKRWKCVFVTAKHYFSPWSYLREIPATAITFVRWFLSKDNI